MSEVSLSDLSCEGKRLEDPGPEMDRVPRYAPSEVMKAGHGRLPVLSYRVHPPVSDPKDRNAPIVASMTALECVTSAGSRWYGCERAWINSELRMVVSGFDARFEEMGRWEKCEVE